MVGQHEAATNNSRTSLENIGTSSFAAWTRSRQHVGERYDVVILITQWQKPNHKYPNQWPSAQNLLALDAMIQVGIRRGHEPGIDRYIAYVTPSQPQRIHPPPSG